jgi:hypothetical protein
MRTGTSWANVETSSHPKNQSRGKFLLILLTGIGFYLISLFLSSYIFSIFNPYKNAYNSYNSYTNITLMIAVAVALIVSIVAEVIAAAFLFRK